MDTGHVKAFILPLEFIQQISSAFWEYVRQLMLYQIENPADRGELENLLRNLGWVNITDIAERSLPNETPVMNAIKRDVFLRIVGGGKLKFGLPSEPEEKKGIKVYVVQQDVSGSLKPPDAVFIVSEGAAFTSLGVRVAMEATRLARNVYETSTLLHPFRFRRLLVNGLRAHLHTQPNSQLDQPLVSLLMENDAWSNLPVPLH